MDADGSFVITWTAQVSDETAGNSVSDIFGRRFEPAGMVAANDPGLWEVDMNNDGVPDTFIQGVRPQATPIPYNSLLPADFQVPGDIYTFRVNTNTTNAQDQSSVAMDDAGNFVVVWVSVGQQFSYFNSVEVQRFSHGGTPIGGEMMVNNEVTDESDEPFVEMSNDGHIGWWSGMTPRGSSTRYSAGSTTPKATHCSTIRTVRDLERPRYWAPSSKLGLPPRPASIRRPPPSPSTRTTISS